MDDFDDQIPRSRMHTGYAWIVTGLLGLGGVAACIVGIVIHWWGQR